jgi:hypothetical protein
LGIRREDLVKNKTTVEDPEDPNSGAVV